MCVWPALTLDRRAHTGTCRLLHPEHQTRGCSLWRSEKEIEKQWHRRHIYSCYSCSANILLTKEVDGNKEKQTWRRTRLLWKMWRKRNCWTRWQPQILNVTSFSFFRQRDKEEMRVDDGSTWPIRGLTLYKEVDRKLKTLLTVIRRGDKETESDHKLRIRLHSDSNDS